MPRSNWWEGVNLAPWARMTEAETARFPFAMAIAEYRARVRGVRQRVRCRPFGLAGFVVTDMVDEPCS